MILVDIFLNMFDRIKWMMWEMLKHVSRIYMKLCGVEWNNTLYFLQLLIAIFIT